MSKQGRGNVEKGDFKLEYVKPGKTKKYLLND